MYTDPYTKTVQKLTVNEITGTNCWFNDNNGDKKNIDCDQLEANSINPRQALANLQGLNPGIETRDGYAPVFIDDILPLTYNEQLKIPRKNGGSKRITRRKTQKRRRR